MSPLEEALAKIKDLESRMDGYDILKRDFERLKDQFKQHQHLGKDGSSRFEGTTEILCSNVIVNGGNRVSAASTFALPLVVVDNVNDKSNVVEASTSFTGGMFTKRAAGYGIAVLSKGMSSEQIVAGMTSGIVPNFGAPFDFKNGVNQSQLLLYQLPQDTNSPPFAFLLANRTPIVLSSSPTGKIVNAGSDLTDLALNLQANSLVGCILVLEDASSTVLEAHPIASNTATVITVTGTWSSATGFYNYYVYAPVFLGSADTPWKRLYVEDQKAIRLGIGSSTGSQVVFICFGTGSPENVVTANVGSIYLRQDGGAGTSFYVKESGSGNTGWIGK